MKTLIFIFAILIAFFVLDIVLAKSYSFNGAVVGKRFREEWSYLQMMDCGNGCTIPIWHVVPANYYLNLRCHATNRTDEASVSKEVYNRAKEGDKWTISARLGKFTGLRYP